MHAERSRQRCVTRSRIGKLIDIDSIGNDGDARSRHAARDDVVAQPFADRGDGVGAFEHPGFEQARQAGAVITATETVVFQLLGRADTDAFREVSKLLR